jgi:hypothetical protein
MHEVFEPVATIAMPHIERHRSQRRGCHPGVVHTTHEPGLGTTFEVELRVAPEPGLRVASTARIR